MTLKITLGQYSDKGRKPLNQDACACHLPDTHQQALKGVVLALADGISSSQVSHLASTTAVQGFLNDYYSTPDSWSVKQSAQRVVSALNAWLYAQTRQSPYRYDKDRGYVCTFSALIIKAATAYLFHVGDSRIYRLHPDRLEQLTQDHRLWVSQDVHYLGRALGINPQVEIDHQALALDAGDIFLLATDGVYDHVDATQIRRCLQQHRDDFNEAARQIVRLAYEQGSTDNLSLQMLRIDSLPDTADKTATSLLGELPVPPLPQVGDELDGYTIIRELHASSRSHVYQAIDNTSGKTLVLKMPSIDRRNDRDYLDSFMMEEWIARRIHNPHVVKAFNPGRQRRFLYTVMEYMDGQTLTQWRRDNPRPGLETVRRILEQIARGLQAFHRLDMLHQDLRPDNILIDAQGNTRIIDFGAVRVAGLREIERDAPQLPPGTAQYSAPEYFLGEAGSIRSDMFSLGVIAYDLLSNGQLPYGADAARCRTRKDITRLRYRPLHAPGQAVIEQIIPVWMDAAIRKAVHPIPEKRYSELPEFLVDLRKPNPALIKQDFQPLLERHPVLAWQCFCLLLALLLLWSHWPG